jgi:hypothetical protein
MKKIIINANQLGIVYKNGAIKTMLKSGENWIGFFETAIIYDKGSRYIETINPEIALENNDFINATTVTTIGENEIAILQINGIFKEVLNPGKCVYFEGYDKVEFQIIDLKNYIIDESIDTNLIAKPALMSYIRTYNIEVNEKGILFIDGKFEKIMDAGHYKFWKNATAMHIVKTDMRTLAMELSGQEILTKDKAQLRINFTVQYKIVDIYKALVENKDCEKHLYTAVQLAMRTIIGRLNIDELMEDKDSINTQIKINVIGAAKVLGIEIIACGIKDIILPADIKNILNQVLIAEKKAQANIITRREETASTRSLLNTAKLMEDNAMLWKLKEMEYVEKIAEKINTISLNGNGQVIDQLKTIFVK